MARTENRASALASTDISYIWILFDTNNITLSKARIENKALTLTSTIIERFNISNKQKCRAFPCLINQIGYR